MKTFLTLLFALQLMCTNSLGQETTVPPKLDLPECDIFLLDLSTEKGLCKLANPRNVTKRTGYDNQPWFTSGGASFLFTANRKPDRTDVFEYFIGSKETKQVTDSPSQEYSPQIGADNKTVSFVTDGEKANQSVWSVDRDGKNETWLLKSQGEREPVGYYSWNRDTGYILFWSRYGYNMRLIHAEKKVSHYVTGNAPPSSPYVIPGTKCFSFVHRQGNGEVWIKELNPETLAIRPLTKVVGANHNYGWTPDGKVLVCEAGKLHQWSADSKKGWQVIADLEKLGIKGATRVAVSPTGKHLAIVGLPNGESE